MLYSDLPTLGLGASLSLSAEPDPVALAQATDGPRFVEYSGQVDVDRVLDEVQRVKSAGIPVLFHPSYINFCGSFANSTQWLQATAAHIATVESPWFAQDCAYCFWQDSYGYSSQFAYFIPPILNQASLDCAVQRVKEVQALSPVPIAIEPPPVSFSAGTMDVLTFFGAVAEQADCALLLDMGHLVSYEMATGQSLIQQIEHFPTERVIEVHVAGGRIKHADHGDIYIDAHEADIQAATWAMLDQMLPHLPNIKALCYECEGVAPERVLSTLAQLREHIEMHSCCEALKAAL